MKTIITIAATLAFLLGLVGFLLIGQIEATQTARNAAQGWQDAAADALRQVDAARGRERALDAAVGALEGSRIVREQEALERDARIAALSVPVPAAEASPACLDQPVPHELGGLLNAR